MKKIILFLFLIYAFIGIANAEAANVLLKMLTVSGTTGTNLTNSFNISAPTGAQLDKTFHFCSFNYDVTSGLHDQMFKATELTSTGSLAIYGGQTGGGNQSLNFDCTVLYFTSASDMTVQRSNIATNATTNTYTFNPALSAANRSFVIPHGERDPSDTTIGSEEVWEYRIVGTGAAGLEIVVDAANNTTGGNRAFFEVVDWGNSDITVQHVNDNTMTNAETTDTIDITAVDLSRTWVIATATWDGVAAASSPIDDAAVRVDFLDNDTIQLRKENSGVQIEWSAQIIEDTSGQAIWTVHQGTIDMDATETTDSITIPYSRTDRTFAIGTTVTGFAYTGQSDDASSGNIETVNASVQMSNPTTITATRGVHNSQTLVMPVQAVTIRGPLRSAIMASD